MFKFKPHFEMYRIKVSYVGDFVGYFCGYSNTAVKVLEDSALWYFTKRGAEKRIEIIKNSKHGIGALTTLEIERAIRSNRVRERISQKAKA